MNNRPFRINDLLSIILAFLFFLWVVMILTGCSREERDERTNIQRDRHTVKQGWAQTFHPTTGEIATLEYGETETEKETTQEVKTVVVTREIVPPKFLNKVMQTFGALGQVTTGGGVVTAALGLFGMIVQRRKRKRAEEERDRERQTADEVAGMDPDEGRKVLVEKRRHGVT